MTSIATLDRGIWEEYKLKKNKHAWEKIIINYAPLVKVVAGRLALVLPRHIDFNELVSMGTLGLIDAIERYDVTLGVKFEAYAYSRIKGAILDGIRKTDWLPRNMRRKAREIEDTYTLLIQRLGRDPDDNEMSSELGVSLEEYRGWLSDNGSAFLFSLDELVDKPPSKLELPEELLEKSEIKKALAAAIDKLPKKEKLIISLYYYDGLTMKEISRVLKLSESRVSQLHSKAILRLRGSLGRKKTFFVG